MNEPVRLAPPLAAAVKVYTATVTGQTWLQHYCGLRPLFACILGFTETGLLPQISAAGATPDQRRYTAIADAEFLYDGAYPAPHHALPPLTAGASPAMISRAVLTGQEIPLYLFNAGLPQPPVVPHIDLAGLPARSLQTGQALPRDRVEALFTQGLQWGALLAQKNPHSYLILGECVVGGTTTAQAVLTALGYAVSGRMGSSHAVCNHAQKAALVTAGLRHWPGYRPNVPAGQAALAAIAAVGDPMQAVAAGMAIAASRYGGVMLAGGSQMLAVFAIARAIAQEQALTWQPAQIVVGTTRWVAEDPSSQAVGLAETIGDVPLIASQLSFGPSRYPQLRAYEQGFVKEGVGAGGCAISAQLYRGWTLMQLLAAVEAVLASCR
ncbi:TIGR00303 family protein [Romeria aff. gracilis LEGE 07310]|uniref:UPF0284 protein IQ241_16275 n=1 Tax=Vasconcelosia minhoensis LEGE 07310 TaxID=915328 RepID=A0A8J7DMI3_9CYAN|nr:TIGR00303 family protein [Romeria gracilis]MBE9078831.1 TIGR00303 family protein [Romeria aff. gracilis LEGE 07310]